MEIMGYYGDSQFLKSNIFRLFVRISEKSCISGLRSKILTLENSQIYLEFYSLIRIFAAET